MWHGTGTPFALVSEDLGTIGLKKDYLAPIGHQIASMHCWGGANMGIQD
jgi:hypothetical protein